MTALYVIGCIIAWLFVGHRVGRHLAPLAYEATRRAYPTLAKGNPTQGRGEARFAYTASLVVWPLTVLVALALRVASTADSAVPGLLAVEVEARQQEILRMQREINDLHRQIGLPDLGGPS